METKFWMVYVEGGSTPACRHETLESARLESERLLGLPSNSGKVVYVLEAVEAGRLVRVPVEWKQL